jgi:hypothetical protein
MNNIILIAIFSFTFLLSEIKINDDFHDFKHIDQFDKLHTITDNTKMLIFTFKKNASHIVNNFLDTKKHNFLDDNKALYIVNVSSMPTIIKWFVLPLLTNYDFPIISLDDENMAKKYKNEEKIESIMIVMLKNKKVDSIKYIDNINNLQKIF